MPENPLGAVLVFAGLAYCAGGAVYLGLEKKEKAVLHEMGDRSLWLLVPGFLAAFLGPPLEYLELPETLPRRDWMEGLGLAFVAAGLALRVWTRRALGQYYRGHLQVQPQQRLIQAGPYQWVRHPGYLGYILIALGLTVGYSSLIGLLSLLLFLLPALVYRIHVEEELLQKAFGEDFHRYVRGTWKLAPGMW
jgi:protein-S-isoprenylcysteine O-methyltransferase Ste14